MAVVALILAVQIVFGIYDIREDVQESMVLRL